MGSGDYCCVVQDAAAAAGVFFHVVVCATCLSLRLSL